VVNVEKTEFDGLLILRSHRHEDERGFLERLFAVDDLESAGVEFRPAHINLSRVTQVGTVKGLHLQRPPSAESKIVRCIAGRVFDVAVDLRSDSATFGSWFGIELSPVECVSLLIPEGFAHGLQSLEPDSVVHYIHSDVYRASAEAGVHPLDSEIGVIWPLPPTLLSERDKSLPSLSEAREERR
jgi:dTDP-4-dehydrorhamnose 3,5-epimerase